MTDRLCTSSDDKEALLAGVKQLGMVDLEGNTGLENEEANVIVEKIRLSIAENQDELDPSLSTLVIDAVNAVPAAKRVVNGKVRTGEEVVRAISDLEAFLSEVRQMKKGKFFEINEEGQLVMMDGVSEAYGLGENFYQAKMRQMRMVYKDIDGQTQIMTGEQYFKVTKRDELGNPLEIEVSEEAKKIDIRSILMARGLPTFQWNDRKHVGEYARMNNSGQFERKTYAWVEDDTVTGPLFAHLAYWRERGQELFSFVRGSNLRRADLGSRGVLKVNLNFES